MFQQIIEALNCNAQSFIRMWIESREISNFSHPAEEVVQVFEDCVNGDFHDSWYRWNGRQRNLWLLLRFDDFENYKEISVNYSYHNDTKALVAA